MPRLTQAKLPTRGERLALMDPARGLFDYVGTRRGLMAALKAPNGHSVLLSVWPDTLLSMLRAGVLTGQALKDAEALRAASASSPEPECSS